MDVPVIETKYLVVTEVGARIGKCERTVRRLIRDGQLRAGILRGRLMVHQSEVERYLAAAKQGEAVASA